MNQQQSPMTASATMHACTCGHSVAHVSPPPRPLRDPPSLRGLGGAPEAPNRPNSIMVFVLCTLGASLRHGFLLLGASVAPLRPLLAPPVRGLGPLFCFPTPLRAALCRLRPVCRQRRILMYCSCWLHGNISAILMLLILPSCWLHDGRH